jgi:preprotein translocase subunit SecA
MDDLKQSVQNAVYEQKDPLLVYKLESFNLFKKMVDEINHDTMSFLFRGVITVQEQQPVKQAPAPQKQDLSKLRATHDEYNNNVSSTAGPGNPNGGAVPQQAPPQKQEPVRNENKTLPNDPCPCGSGKKYKKCHGAMDH